MSRFGHTSDFTVLFVSDEDVVDGADTEDYLLGLIFAGCLIVSFFLAWALLLLVFKCCLGQRKVGFLSGSPYRISIPEPKEKEQSPLPEEGPEEVPVVEKKSRCGSRPMRGRVLFLLSGIVYITFTTLLVTEGLTNLQSSANTLSWSSREVESISTEAQEIIQTGLVDLKDLAIAVRERLAEQFQGNQFCPADPGLQNSEVGRDISTQANEAVTLLDQLTDFASDNVTDLDDSISRLQSYALDVADTTEDIDLNDWEALMILIPYIMVPAILMAACAMACFDVSFPFLHCTIHYFFMPLLMIMTAVAFLTAGIVIMAAGANSDFCLPGGRSDATPDTTVKRILELEGYGQGSKVYDIFSYYIEKCAIDEDPFLFLRQYVADLVSILYTVMCVCATLLLLVAHVFLHCNPIPYRVTTTIVSASSRPPLRVMVYSKSCRFTAIASLRHWRLFWMR
jgi:hypothetical protein